MGAFERRCTCLADIVDSGTFQPPGDGQVDGADLAFLLGEWGSNPNSPADIVDSATFMPPPDDLVDGADLAYLLGSWGDCPEEDCTEESESLMGGGESSSTSGGNPYNGTYLGLLLDELLMSDDAEVAGEALTELLETMSE